MSTLNAMLDRSAQEGGEKTFLVHDGRSFSFSAVFAQVLSVAEGLRRSGLKKGDRVAIVHRNAPEFVIAYFAANRLGAIAVPINFMVQKADELAYMLKDSGASGVVTQTEFLPGLTGAAAKCPGLKAIWVTDFKPKEGRPSVVRSFDELRSPAPTGPAPDPVVENDVAAILYTSGTTGFPKGVMLTHRNLVTNCESSLKRITLNRKDVTLCILPMFHSFAWTAIVLTSTRLTLKCVIFSAIAPPRPWLKAMGEHGVTLFAAVPQIYAALAREARDFKTRLYLRWWSFRKVRVAASGAAPLPPAVAEAFARNVGVDITEGWGLTETSPVATIAPPGALKLGFVGTPIEGCRLKIVDDDEKELALGAEGEICVKGDNVMKGYWRLPDATKAAFTADGWLKTGDVGIIDPDGYLAIRDRKKDMIIVKGLKVFSAQVEAILAENPDIAESAVVGVPDEEGDETIKAFVVLKKGCCLEKSALLQYFREKLDAYKRPRDVEIVESLPKNALQKVLKRELREREVARRSGTAGKA
ncbi:MAG TPA: long-chain-fatty-acid--CoA ligase [Elusimicrobiota bacterium]|jgi:long-chain acyl-CoA synthetase|nr:long-chain-fatty-acid--CoA ligase [Elusimicrobiota bacterium]